MIKPTPAPATFGPSEADMARQREDDNVRRELLARIHNEAFATLTPAEVDVVTKLLRKFTPGLPV